MSIVNSRTIDVWFTVILLVHSLTVPYRYPSCAQPIAASRLRLSALLLLVLVLVALQPTLRQPRSNVEPWRKSVKIATRVVGFSTL